MSGGGVPDAGHGNVTRCVSIIVALCTVSSGIVGGSAIYFRRYVGRKSKDAIKFLSF